MVKLELAHVELWHLLELAVHLSERVLTVQKTDEDQARRVDLFVVLGEELLEAERSFYNEISQRGSLPHRLV